ncbi:hypothetical protein KI688_000025 [Linnemannia hyalina]|uniref:Uncharacterized protein n=1 Tax=Linnemannia hyalina TaxID=64524 RepID=A0A9P7Y6B4_9FUNG|nr:hypothetical protein KI688_000025 [Linnemannia hyalina]
MLPDLDDQHVGGSTRWLYKVRPIIVHADSKSYHGKGKSKNYKRDTNTQPCAIAVLKKPTFQGTDIVDAPALAMILVHMRAF